MAAYHKVEVSLNTNAVEVGIPSPQSVTVTVPTVGPVGPQGPAGPKGDPGEVSGSIAWDNVTDKPSTFTPSSHTHVADDITDFTSAVEAASPPADWDTLANKPASFTPSAHSSTHHTGGTDALAAHQINGQTIFGTGTPTYSSDQTLGAARALQLTVSNTNASGINLTLPAQSDGTLNGDTYVVIGGGTLSGPITVRRINLLSPLIYQTLATITATGQQYRFRASGGQTGGWTLVPVDTHSHPSTQITGLGTAAAQDSTAFAPATGIDPTAITGTAVVDSDARLSDSRTPTSHSSSHATGGSDPLAPSDIGLGAGDDVTFNSVAIEGGELKTNSGALSILDADGPEKASLQVSNLELFNESTGGGYALFDAQGNLTGARIYDLPDRSGELMIVGDAPASHTHGNITNDGLVGTTANLPLKTGTGGIVEAGAFGTGAGEFAEGNHTHSDLHTRSHAITSTSDHTAGNHKVFYSDGSGEIVELALGNSGEVLTSNGATSAPSFAAASGGGVTAVDATTADVLSVSGSDLVADDGGTIDSADPFIKWDDTAGKLVYANPLSRPSGAFYVGLAPTTTALGTDAVNIQNNRGGAIQVASGGFAVAIGDSTRASNSTSVAIGYQASSTGASSLALGRGAIASGNESVSIGRDNSASATESVAIGRVCVSSGAKSVAIGRGATATLRSEFSTDSFNAVYWGGQTTNATPLILNLDATATNRFTIAANTALAVDILLVARRSDVADKWLVARRFLGIRRDGSNNTSLIGSVQTLGTDQTDGSPTWSFTLTADDTNEALQLEVTGAASETVQWRATAFYRVV